MKTYIIGWTIALLIGPWSPTDFDSADPLLPTLFIVGDSTAATGGPVTHGWGAMLIDYFDPAKVNIVNWAVGGRSFRTFTSEGRWARVVEHLKEGDFVIIELGHNDGGGVNAPKYRGDVPGIGEETETVKHPDGTNELVRTYGWYMRKYIREAREKGAIPIVSTPTTRNIWTNGRVERGREQVHEWAQRVAENERALFLDHTNIIADLYEGMGRDKVAKVFPGDRTHTNIEGARINAEAVIAGLKSLEVEPLLEVLSAKGQAINPHGRGPSWRPFSESASRTSSLGNAIPTVGKSCGDVP